MIAVLGLYPVAPKRCLNSSLYKVPRAKKCFLGLFKRDLVEWRYRECRTPEYVNEYYRKRLPTQPNCGKRIVRQFVMSLMLTRGGFTA